MSCFDFRGTYRVAGVLGVTFDIASVTHVYGLGFSQVDFEDRSIGYRARLWVLSTPVDGKSIDLTLAMQVGIWSGQNGRSSACASCRSRRA